MIIQHYYTFHGIKTSGRGGEGSHPSSPDFVSMVVILIKHACLKKPKPKARMVNKGCIRAMDIGPRSQKISEEGLVRSWFDLNEELMMADWPLTQLSPILISLVTVED